MNSCGTVAPEVDQGRGKGVPPSLLPRLLRPFPGTLRDDSSPVLQRPNVESAGVPHVSVPLPMVPVWDLSAGTGANEDERILRGTPGAGPGVVPQVQAPAVVVGLRPPGPRITPHRPVRASGERTPAVHEAEGETGVVTNASVVPCRPPGPLPLAVGGCGGVSDALVPVLNLSSRGLSHIPYPSP